MTALRQRDVYPRIYVSPREVEQCVAKRRARRPKPRSTTSRTSWLRSPSRRAPSWSPSAWRAPRASTSARRTGEDFAQLAIAYSDAGTALEGGALGWRKAGQLPSFVAELIPAMQPGPGHGAHAHTERPASLQAARGARRRAGRARVAGPCAAHPAETNEIEDDETVRQKLVAIRERILSGESFEAIASVTSADPASAANGGDLDWQGPGTFVPEFEQQLDTLSENEISQPFKTQYGWHIVQLLGRRTYDATDDVIRNRCFAQMREARADEETELWLRRLRDEAFVEYRM